MADSEDIDGPRLAAQILSRMDPQTQIRIKQAIYASDPAIAEKISASMFRFADIAQIPARGLQQLIGQVDHKDLVLSLKDSPADVRSAILGNMSERKQKLVIEDLAATDPVQPAEIKHAQSRILEKIDELRTLGRLRTGSKKDMWV